MDPLGVLEAVVALAIYPGGVFLAGLVVFAGRLARAPRWHTPRPRELAALITIDLAVAGAPLPASPAGTLPPTAGTAPDLVVAALLVAASVVLVAPRRWDSRRLLSAAGATTAAALAVIATASLALTTITAHPGGEVAAVRAIAALAVLVAAPLLCGSPAGPQPGRRAALTGMALLGLSLLVPAGLAGWAAVAGAAAAGGATVAYVVMVSSTHALLARMQTLLSAACGALGTAAIVVVLVAGRA